MTHRRMKVEAKSWPLKEPFVIARSTQTTCEVIVVTLELEGAIGRGEAAGVPYHQETPERMRTQVEAVRREIERGADRVELIDLLPPGGARNALDAALWDLEAKRSGRSVWELAAVTPARPVTTAITIGIRSLADFESRARMLAGYPWIKVKVSADRPLDAVAAVRRGAPRAQLIVDANQSWSVSLLQSLADDLAALRVDLLEQPVPASDDAGLEHVNCAVALCADEAVHTIADLETARHRYDFVNIKLDKTGGLTAAFELAREARAMGLRLMTGCMIGGSLAMAPAMVLAQLCEVADLDGPLLQAADWPDGIVYRRGTMQIPAPALWG